MKFQQPLFLENGGELRLPPNPDMINTNIPDLLAWDSIQQYPLTTKYRFNGKTFVYARAVVYVSATGLHVNAVLSAYKGAMNDSRMEITWTTTNVHSHDAGSEQIVIEKSGVTKDEYKYGHVELVHGGDTTPLGRGILGNTVSDGDCYVTLDLDIPLELETVHDTTALELYKSEYAAVLGAITAVDYNYGTIVGIPMVNKGGAGLHALTGQWFWLQTWGPCYIQAGGATQGASVAERTAIFDAQGQLEDSGAFGNKQIVGIILPKTKDASTSYSAADDCMCRLMLDP